MKPITAILIMSLLTLSSQSPEKSVIEKYLDAPAIYYSAVSKDSVLYSYFKGNRSVSSNQLIDKNSQFALFSITKIFTSIAILQLIENRKLTLEDKVSSHLSKYSYLGDISIHQLLSHQSGLNNPLPLNWIHLSEEDASFNYQKFSTEILQKKAKVKFMPGKKASYSNLNFLLLGEIIEKVTGVSYQQYIIENVLAGNTNIGFKWDDENAVTGYHDAGFSGWLLKFLIDKPKFTKPREGNLIPFNQSYLNGSAYGGLITNASGLTQFLQELLKTDNKILSEHSKKVMFREQLLTDGKPSGHSLGWYTGNLNGKKYVHHAGGGGGFYLELRIYPELEIATYVLTNKTGFSDKRILDKLDRDLLNIR